MKLCATIRDHSLSWMAFGPAFVSFPLELSSRPITFVLMPLYEFHCEKCRRDSEILVRSTRWEGTPCPHCGSTKLAKKFSVFASSSGEGGAGEAPACTSNPRSCGRCGTGVPHSH
ncbi:MAG: zinc ribbon domain-containing protein [Verrucomicrobia bacterium]|nr:zinc ribbon domain-containing protein [Verrucomicrobiota bacterium]